MLLAASVGNLTDVDRLINRNSDVNYRDDEVKTEKFVSLFGSVCIFPSFGLTVCVLSVCVASVQ